MSEEKERFEFDLNAITYDEIQQLDLMEPIEQEAHSIKLVVKSLKHWPFEVKISEANIRQLGMLDFVELQQAFSAVLASAFKSIKEAE